MIHIPVYYRVVQGSALGAILFLIKIILNDISKLTIIGKLFLFAEDYLIFIQGNGWHDVRIIALIRIPFSCHNLCIGMSLKTLAVH